MARRWNLYAYITLKPLESLRHLSVDDFLQYHKKYETPLKSKKHWNNLTFFAHTKAHIDLYIIHSAPVYAAFYPPQNKLF